jgi:Na+/H+ antiporter NhaC
MHIFLSLLGIIASFFILKYRKDVGDMVGEADWMRKIGGVYNVIIICSIILFFWSLAELTGTTQVLFSPLTRLIPGMNQSVPSSL